MFKTNVSRVFILLLGVALFTTACEKDKDNPKPKPATVYEVKTVEDYNVKDHTKWYYFSFDNGFVGEGSATPADGDDSLWMARMDWDIAFHRNNVRTNGGMSGNGQGGVMILNTNDFESVTQVPEGEFVVDTIYTKFMNTPDMPPVYITSTLNEEANSWANYNHDEGAWLLEKRNVFVIKTANGKYAKLQFLNFLNDEDASGYMTLQYVYAKDGGTTF